jgi:hypothetical protein
MTNSALPAPLISRLIAKTLRVPALDYPMGDGAVAARRLDVALMSVGFKCSGRLLRHLSSHDEDGVERAGRIILAGVRELVGDHVQHNAYFIDFPRHVPDTEAFWLACIERALADPNIAPWIMAQLEDGRINLLDLPIYGRYQHSYDEMLERHDELIASRSDRSTTLDLGGTLDVEVSALYARLAESIVPLSEGDLVLLRDLAALRVWSTSPSGIPMRESRAVVNAERMKADMPVAGIDTPLDVLRAAFAWSGGDVSLATPTKLKSMPRRLRRDLLRALDRVVSEGGASKLNDIGRHAEAYKRLGERLHPHEYRELLFAAMVFEAARGERVVESLAGQVESALAVDDVETAVDVLSHAPGMYVRSVDRLLRSGASADLVARHLWGAAPTASLRVLLSLREHLTNRTSPDPVRLFVNREGRSYSTPDTRTPLSEDDVAVLNAALDKTIADRLPRVERLCVDPLARGVALPLSNKMRPNGLGILPRGSVQPLVGDHLRFFIYWREQERRTDYDLSLLVLDADLQLLEHVSWTSLRGVSAVHSGDITESAGGATEFIDVDLSTASKHARYLVPQVNVYSGEHFDDVAEAFFGFMTLDGEDHGRPFEPRTVQAKSDLYGGGRVALPLVFSYEQDEWRAKWAHLNLRGNPNFNVVESNHRSVSALMRGIVQRSYLTVDYLVERLVERRAELIDPLEVSDTLGPVTYIGMDSFEGLPDGSVLYTPVNLHELLSSA